MRRAIEMLIEDKQGGIRSGGVCVQNLHTETTGVIEHEIRSRAYIGFMNLEKEYDRVNREVQWWALIMCDAGGKILNGIISVYINSLTCVRTKGRESAYSLYELEKAYNRVSRETLL